MPQVIYSDTDILIIDKSAGEDSERLAESLGAFPCHRLDKATSGLLLLAKSKRAAALLSAHGSVKKTYIATVEGTLEQKSGVLEDLLWYDARRNKSFVVDRERAGVKRALLEYRVIAETGENTTVECRMITGRTHQIRVQFASRRHPVCGDKRYGAGTGGELKLRCSKLEFTHPNGEKLSFEI
ncbi:MAG: RluA family pseudouridine synthase [Clostridia bacterium]|nr:RluA family pseudouridine synthase [Clostridia bacterium]